MDLFEAQEKENNDNDEQVYVAPDPLFISVISLFSNSFPWERFKKFFSNKKLVGLNAEEQIILLRFLAIQELLCLDDKTLLRWLKNQFYLFNFMQPDFKPRLPSQKLLQQFRSELNSIGLLEPFRKQCQHIIKEHAKRFPITNRELRVAAEVDALDTRNNPKYLKATESNMPQSNNTPERSCGNCGSQNMIKLESSQEQSSLPDIRFLRCNICGHTFRD